MTRGIRWLSVGPPSGYGTASLAYRRGLRAAGVAVGWTPLGWPSNLWQAPFGPVDDGALTAGGAAGDSGTTDPTGRLVEHDTVVVHSTPLWHERLEEASAGRLLAAYTTWETDRLPADWVAMLNRYDVVLVPSRFNARVFEDSGVAVPLRVVPHIALDAPVAPGSHAALPGAGRFVFYLIATWTSRKAILDAVEAFVAAFGAGDDVVLLVHTSATDLVARARLAAGPPAGQGAAVASPPRDATWFSLAKALAGRRNLPEIVLSTRPLPRAAIEALHLRGDCFVNLSRGEGWGLGAFEAAAFGNPVIVTGWGATSEFLPPGYPYLVDYDLVPTTGDPPDAWWEPRPGERWAKARRDHAVALLRHVVEHEEQARTWGEAARAHVREAFDSARITGVLLDALSGGGRRDSLAPVTASSSAGSSREPGAGEEPPPGATAGGGDSSASDRPVASDGLEVNETDDGVIVYQESTDRVHHLNPSAAVILELCDGSHSVEDIARELAQLFGLDAPALEETRAAVEHLRYEGLVV